MIILDRFEEDKAVLEIDGRITEAAKETVDENAREGDVLTENCGRFSVDRTATEERRAAMRAKMRRLIQKND